MRLSVPLKNVVLGMVLAVVTLAAPLNHATAKTSDQIAQSSSRPILLQNFPSQAEVYYMILSGSKLLAEGSQKTDENGNLTIQIKAPSSPSDEQTNIIYDFKISKDGEYLDLLMRENPETGKISAMGKGLDDFSDITLTTSGKTKTSKADWSGAFAETGIMIPHKDIEPSFQIALHGFSGMENFAQPYNPPIIKILKAPGGGLLSETPNEPPQLSPPSSGLYNLSTSDAGNLSSLSDSIVDTFVTAMLMITEELSVVMMKQVMIIGTFFDAKIQMEVQRTHQELTVQAVKDYHPSEQMCKVGSFVRSLADTDQRVMANKYAFNDVLMTRYKQEENAASSYDSGNEISARVRQYREKYCNPKDNNSKVTFMCEHDQDGVAENSISGAVSPKGIGAVTGTEERINKDVSYTRTMDYPKTIDVDMFDGVEADDEEDVIALAKNLYWPRPVEYGPNEELSKKTEGFLNLQRVMTLKNMAHGSYANLVALKARAERPDPKSTVKPGWTFMKTMLREFGVKDEEIERMVGVEPSYWAQMDVLSKKMYQLPSFYTNLYDKPVNVERMSVTLDAIKLMQMRDTYNAQLRFEMLNSGMLETELALGGHYDRPAAILAFE